MISLGYLRMSYEEFRISYDELRISYNELRMSYDEFCCDTSGAMTLLCSQLEMN